MQIPDHHPVIVGTGQRTWRDSDVGRTPVDALHEAAAAAIADCGGKGVADAIETLATVRFIADTRPDTAALFPRNPGAEIARRLGLADPALFIGAIGGNTPQYLVNHFASGLARGEYGAVLLTGGELMATLFAALRSGGDLGAWAGDDTEEPPTVGAERDGLSAMEERHGLYQPINTYPLFENSLRHHLGLDETAHGALLADISSRMSAVAAANPNAWRQEALSAGEIATVGPRNRYIGYPYTRAMNALLEVDMSAAVVMTTAGRARQLGIDPERWIYLRGGVDLNDIWYPSERRDLHSSPAIELAWQHLSKGSGLGIGDLSHFDIYSCFPSAVQIGCAALGLSPLDPRGVTVTGGLPFFGGPGNNYSLHAIAQMIDTLRAGSGGAGLVTAVGLYMTKHSLGLYATEPGEPLAAFIDSDPLQAAIESGPRVAVAADASGPATVETWTVAFDRNGPRQGILVARNADGERLVANTADDAASLEALLTEDPIGHSGRVRVEDGRNIIEL